MALSGYEGKRINNLLHRPPTLAKIRALTSLLRLWYAPERSDDIICLGVCSNGSFGTPPGVVFSQPVMLDEKSKWMPFSKFPLKDDSSESAIKSCIASTKDILEAFGLLKYYCERDDDEICSNVECPMSPGRPL
ncbi:hypothetical protein NQ317_018853 [Molorchus minor]|uniref:Uncharacterized protein n=1 Tax=Molorchus minor TaxID=1323400 RepID=A0ABQ9J8B5_9CUCU|nr:hypothetical protein NQ317_018853 [Molorchus minor]